MLGFTIPIGTMPLGSTTLGGAAVTCGVSTTSFTTFTSIITAGAANIDVSNSPFVEFTSYDADVESGASVSSSVSSITFTGMDALVLAAGTILPSSAVVSFTPFDPYVHTPAYINSNAGSVSFSTFVATVATPAIITPDTGVVQFAEFDADISTSALVAVDNTQHISFSTFSSIVKVGRNPKIYRESQKFSPSNLVVLYELDARPIGGEYMRFTSSAHESDAIRFGGNLYVPVPVEADGFEMSSQGSLPTPKLRILNTPTLQAGVIALDDLLGCVFYRVRTFRDFLDDGEDADGEAKFPVDVYKIERKVAQTKVYIEWELSASMDQEGRMIPGRQIIRDYCTHIYRVWNAETEDFDYTKATCPYVGVGYYDETDATVNASQDRCGKRLSSCRLRFGATSQLPTRSFPGVAKVR